MTSAISSLSGSGTTQATSFDPSKGAARFASKVFGDMDADKDGSVTKDEFVKGLESKGVSADDAAKQFDAIDTQKSGAITRDDLEGAIKSGTFQPPRPQGGAHGGGRSEGAGGAQAAGGAGSVSTSSSSTKTYEAADSNQDGSVSQQEQLIYDLSHGSGSTSDASKIGTNFNAVA
ncbi:EF-hand domain-containing protein [Duganella callida]|uniref:EF-hand domain-containing protein n=1 Tax=Duganella callida TaxID=2561932 RepID=A0A4Y9SJV6_9BURK|nr:EF-hand domain-containing protein [Duganella callida]TFW26605.1 EF-hand domain-containing protein [Duganella callida]